MVDDDRATPPADRPLRAHARRNRDALLGAAREAFAAGEADIRVEEIARRAGVGVGTFYRHFPTREAVVEAVYDERVRDMCAHVQTRLATDPPHDALRAFLEQLIQHAVDSRSMAAALKTLMDLGSPVFNRGRETMVDTIGQLMAAGVAAGTIRADITADTVFRAMGGICASHGQPGWEDAARDVVHLLYDGLRHTAPRS
ncbi:TetR/AcrR family transcriptional regulator [Streptomyces ortus]|uniref:TetR/AcrR family transcriptional regulator n=1 Tax=Streptomyces ortus TaxID=2867268 RepID=A0ABT3V436_9ACTN|nr:TetR/AcrR family transcriptional regulator [Streptomyces ortus]MCX4234764.1 TetR/AcrR family transcriptional regulator [Streptomyces ortus]